MHVLLFFLLFVGSLARSWNPLVLQQGCGIPQKTGYSNDTESHQLISGGIMRSYTIQVPMRYNDDKNTKWPMIFDFHGKSGDGDRQHEISRYYHYTDDYIVVYPNGVGNCWQGANYADPSIDDVQFVSDLLMRIKSMYCIDLDRIYASGKSNGGGFADTLACSPIGNQFAAFAMNSAALYHYKKRQRCQARRAIIESHGMKDPVIPYSPRIPRGGDFLPDISKWVGWWAARDGCRPRDKRVLAKKGYNITSYSCGGLQDVVKHYKVFNMAHCWPSGNEDNYDTTKASCTDRSLDFTAEILKFFSKWTLSTAPQNY